MMKIIFFGKVLRLSVFIKKLIFRYEKNKDIYIYISKGYSGCGNIGQQFSFMGKK